MGNMRNKLGGSERQNERLRFAGKMQDDEIASLDAKCRLLERQLKECHDSCREKEAVEYALRQELERLEALVYCDKEEIGIQCEPPKPRHMGVQTLTKKERVAEKIEAKVEPSHQASQTDGDDRAELPKLGDGICPTCGDRKQSRGGASGDDDGRSVASTSSRGKNIPTPKSQFVVDEQAQLKRRRTSMLGRLGTEINTTSKRLLPLTGITAHIYDIIEKKVIAEHASRAAGNKPEPFATFVKEYWHKKLGLKKLAKKKIAEMVKGVANYTDSHSRVTWFAYLIGLSQGHTRVLSCDFQL